jgi:Aminoglycoside adenylyltransferase, C-terminal domain
VIPPQAEEVAARLQRLLVVDVLGVSTRPLPRARKRELLDMLLDVSGSPRQVELDLVLVSTLRAWQHPAPFEFHYSESLRERFEAGEVEPWEVNTNRDLAAHVAVTREAGVALVGPPPEDLFPEIPSDDFRDALLYDVEWWREHVFELEAIPGGVRNAVLSLARIWASLATGTQHSKATGVEWALPRLPADLPPVLEHARNLYTGHEDVEGWPELPVAAYIATVAAEIGAIIPPR